MDIVIIERKAWEELQAAFISFVKEVERNTPIVIEYEGWLNNEDVCRLLNLSKRSLQTYRDTGLLPYSMVGHKVFYKSEDVQALLVPSLSDKEVTL